MSELRAQIDAPTKNPFQFIESIGRQMQKKLNIALVPKVDAGSLDAQYREMAADEAREQEALEWAETLVGDVVDERR